MRLTIEATDQLTHLDGVPCRVWKAKTAAGVDCFVFVHRIAALKSADTTEFDCALKEQLPPSRWISIAQVL